LVQLFVFGRIVGSIICIRPNSDNDPFGTALVFTELLHYWS